MRTIREILSRKQGGQDCNERESAEVKAYLRNEFGLRRDEALAAELVEWFPLEADELAEDVQRFGNAAVRDEDGRAA